MEKPRTITLKQKFAIGQRLQEVLTERTDGMWEFQQGWDSQRVADEFNIAKHLVDSVRKRAFGKLANATGGRASTSELEKRVVRLEEAFRRLDSNWDKIKL